MSGHIFDMVNRIRQNKIPRRKKFKGDNRELMHADLTQENVEYDFPEITESDLDQLRIRIQELNRKNKRNTLYALMISVIIIALLLVFFLKTYQV